MVIMPLLQLLRVNLSTGFPPMAMHGYSWAASWPGKRIILMRRRYWYSSFKGPRQWRCTFCQKKYTYVVEDNTPVSTDIRAGYTFDSFREPYSRLWQVFNAVQDTDLNGDRIRRTKYWKYQNWWTISFQCFWIADRSWSLAKITSKNYADLEYAYSPGPYFPRHRAQLKYGRFCRLLGYICRLKLLLFDRSAFIAVSSVESTLANIGCL